MFTGIVKDIGIIESISKKTNSLLISISTTLDKKFLMPGLSISCHGCCLTVLQYEQQEKKNIFMVDIGYQTLLITNFSKFSVGNHLNLEPAMCIGDSLSGHYVYGHIDALCCITEIMNLNDNFFKLCLLIPFEYIQWVIPKGSISISGISLTIANISSGKNGGKVIEIMIIPHTYNNTALKYYKAGMKIEVEFDNMAKTIASTLEGMLINSKWKDYRAILPITESFYLLP